MASYNIETLDTEAKKRYKNKLEMIGMINCPNMLPADIWTNDPTNWPALEYPEVYSYLIETPGVFTKEAMNNRKSLEAHNQFRSGWVRTIFHYDVPATKFVIMKANVNPSQRLNDEPHTPWVAINRESISVMNAHCTCMAGLGESCTHIGALLFKIEAAVRAGFTRRACTDEACLWNDDFKENVTPAELCNINLYSAKSIENFKGKQSNNSFPGTAIQPTQNEIDSFIQSLSQQKGNKPIVLHAYSKHYENYIPKYKPPARAKLPKSLRDWYSPTNREKTDKEISTISNKVLESLTVSDETNNYLQQITNKQAESPVWHDIRSGRITASRAHDVLHTSMEKPAESLIKTICQKSKVCHTTVPSLKWGIENEKKAIDDAYLRHMDNHCNFSINSSGMRVHPKHPYISASPDGIFTCQCHEINRLVEVKCPYSKRDTLSVEDAVKDQSFFLDSELNLKQGHKYYTQIQIQLFVFNFQECEFIVWTPQWIHSEIVSFNDAFLKNSIPVLDQFFKTHIIAELLTRRLENKDELPVLAPKRYCVCNSEYNSNENWIGCDSKNCKGEWFHYKCVNVKRPPKGSWYCPPCKKLKGAKRKHEKK